MNTVSPTAPAVHEPTSPIKPSEALRLGRLTHPDRPPAGRPQYVGETCACAVGAIGVGLGYEWDGFADANVNRYVADRLGWPMTDSIEAMYEGWAGADHKWSDAEIVAWLEAQGL